MKRATVFWFTNLVGPLILASYWRGVGAVDDPLVYWGDATFDAIVHRPVDVCRRGRLPAHVAAILLRLG